MGISRSIPAAGFCGNEICNFHSKGGTLQVLRKTQNKKKQKTKKPWTSLQNHRQNRIPNQC